MSFTFCNKSQLARARNQEKEKVNCDVVKFMITIEIATRTHFG